MELAFLQPAATAVTAMVTATLKPGTCPAKQTHENEIGAETETEPPTQTASATGGEYFALVARATNDAVRDWNVGSGALLWPRGLDTGLGHLPSTASAKISFWFDHLHPDDLPRIQQSLKQAFQSTTDHWTGEYRFRRPSGEYLAIRERALIVRSGKGTALRFVGVMMDVTERQQLQAQFCRAQRMEAFGQLAGGLAHDFNNFLTTILGYSDLLLSETMVKEPIASQIKEIRDAAGRASSLTNQLLAFSRRQALEPAVLEVNSLMTNLERSLLRLLGENISVVCQLHQLKEGAHVKVDPNQFEQIIVNLALNARDAMLPGGCLTITTSTLVVKPNVETRVSGFELSPGEYVAITMTDNGRGLSDAARARLFEPFFTTKDPARHSGLGLATSYGIVRQSGGQICAESEPGRGTSFHILLPRVAPPPRASYKKPTQRRLPTGTETVLVLEDEVGVRHLSVRVLRSLGYEVLEAAHGKDAKRLVTKGGLPKIDLLLTDMMLPEMSGRDFADWLVVTSPATKVIFISGYLEESLDPCDRRDPEMRFLAKPFSAEQLASKVREVLDGR